MVGLNKMNIGVRFLQRVTKLPKFLGDKSVSLFSKLVVIMMFGYIISPIDLIPEPIVGLGLIDDTLLTFYIISTISDKLDTYIEIDRKNEIKNPIESHDYKVVDEDEE